MTSVVSESEPFATAITLNTAEAAYETANAIEYGSIFVFHSNLPEDTIKNSIAAKLETAPKKYAPPPAVLSVYGFLIILCAEDPIIIETK